MRFYIFFSSLIIIISIAILLYLVSSFYPYTADDSFIIFRYSKNLANGYGPVYNPNLERAEGYTCFLWMLIMTIPHLLNLDAVSFSKIIGIISTFIYIVVCFGTVFYLTRSSNNYRHYLPCAFVVLLISLFISTSVHAVSGMETALFTLTLTTFLCLITIFINDIVANPLTANTNKRLFFFIVLLGLLTGLTRPEGNLVILIALFLTFVLIPKSRRLFFIRITLFLYVLPGFIYFLWRYYYYESIFPIPFYVKVLLKHFNRLADGKIIVLNFVKTVILPLGIFIILAFVKLGIRLLPSFIAVCSLIIFFIFPQHIMGFNWRYIFPVAPFIFVIAGIGVFVLQDYIIAMWLRINKSFKPYILVVTFILCIGLCFFGGKRFINIASEDIYNKKHYANGLETAHIPLGKKLNQIKKLYIDSFDRIPVLAITDAGAVPYYSEWQTIDIYGLNDPNIVFLKKYDPNYILSRNPDVVVLISRSKETFVLACPWEKGLYQKCLQKGMINVDVLTFRDKYFLWIMAFPGSLVGKIFK